MEFLSFDIQIFGDTQDTFKRCVIIIAWR